MSKMIRVDRVQVNAAQILVRHYTREGRPVSERLRAIAEVQPDPHIPEFDDKVSQRPFLIVEVQD